MQVAESVKIHIFEFHCYWIQEGQAHAITNSTPIPGSKAQEKYTINKAVLRIRDVLLGSRIRFFPFRFPDPGIKKAPDPGSGFQKLK
jgi:hypothetical protein